MSFTLSTAGRVADIEVGISSVWTVTAGSVQDSTTSGVVTVSGSDVDVADLRITGALATALTISGDRNRVEASITATPTTTNTDDVIVVSGDSNRIEALVNPVGANTYRYGIALTGGTNRFCVHAVAPGTGVSNDGGAGNIDCAAAGGASPLTTKGDLFGYDTADARVPVGADGTFLKAASADAQGVVYASITEADVTDLDHAGPIATHAAIAGAHHTRYTDGEADARIAAATLDDLSDVTITAVADNEVLAYDSGAGVWVNAVAPSGSSPLTTKGDLHGYAAADARIPVGANGTFLKADSTDAEGIVWATPDHGALTGLADDDHAQYLLVSGTRAMTGALDMGAQYIENVTIVRPPSGTTWLQMQDGGSITRIRIHQNAVGDIDLTNAAGSVTLLWDESDTRWEFAAKPLIGASLAATEADVAATLDLAGTRPMTGTLDMGGQQIRNVSLIRAPSGLPVYIQDDTGIARLSVAQSADGRILFTNVAGATTLTWDESDGRWEFAARPYSTADSALLAVETVPRTSFVPTVANFTLGNGTRVGYYRVLGGIADVDVTLTFGSTSAFTSVPILTLPVNAVLNGITATENNVGGAAFYDTSAAAAVRRPTGDVRLLDTTTAAPYARAVSGSYIYASAVLATVPFTWAVGDVLHMHFSYPTA